MRIPVRMTFLVFGAMVAGLVIAKLIGWTDLNWLWIFSPLLLGPALTLGYAALLYSLLVWMRS